MTKFYIIIVLLILTLSSVLNAQNVGFSYQAVALDRSKAEGFGRDTEGEVLSSQDIQIRFSLSEGSIDGNTSYQETHETTTDIFGMFRLIVGRGERLMSSRMDELDWGNIPYFLHVEISLEGSFEYMGAEELLGSPYALNVKNQTLVLNGDVISISNGNEITLNDNDAENELQSISMEGNILTLSNGGGSVAIGTGGSVSQELTRGGDEISLSNGGGTVSIVDGDDDDANELQDLKLMGHDLTITNNGAATTIDLSGYMDDTHISTEELIAILVANGYFTENDLSNYLTNNGYLTNEVDGSITNEIQDLNLSGDNLTITNNGSATTIDLSTYLDDTNTQLTEVDVIEFVSDHGFLITEVDGSVSNEIQDISTTGVAGNITLSSGSTLALNVDDADANNSNELQTISKTGSTVTLSNSGGTFTDAVDDADASINNEIQDLNLTGDNLTITNNGSATTIDLNKYSVFVTASNVTSNSPGTIATDDFVFGSTQLDDSGDPDQDSRMFFDKSKGAFRAGVVVGSQWDDVNVGNYSTAFGNAVASGESSTAWGVGGAYEVLATAWGVGFATGSGSTAWGNATLASGVYSTAWGEETEATGSGSTAWGISTASGTSSTAWGNSTASGFYSTAWGISTASGTSSTAWGQGTIAPSQGETSLGQYNTTYTPDGGSNIWDVDDRLFTIGNGTSNASRSDALIIYKDGNGDLAGTLTQSSDKRLKTEITSLTNSLTAVSQLQGVHYKWNDVKPHDMESLQTGLIAQEVKQLFPELVAEGFDGYLSVNYIGLIPHLIEAIKELKNENEELKAANDHKQAALEERMAAMEQVLNQLSSVNNN